ncbi:MAG: hypothetical protein RL248_1905, partial [Pseudomonadota bacterium]
LSESDVFPACKGISSRARTVILSGSSQWVTLLHFNWEWGRHIEELTHKYCVEYIGIDATTVGQGVFQLVRQFFPAAREIKYTPEIKTAMVLKARHTINNGRLEYDTGYTDITQSFMAIRKTMTASGARSTYVASRSEEASHADVAWAIMHALLNEPLTATYGGHSPNFLEFYG